jgi:hypothetical protein
VNKTNTDRRRSSYTEKDFFSRNHRTTATQATAELNIHPEYPVSIKTLRQEFHKTNINGRTAIAKPVVTESNAQMRKRWCHDHKTWTSGNWKRASDMVRWVILHAVPYIRKNLRLENTQGSLQSGMSGSNSKTRGRFCDGLSSNIVVEYSVCPIIIRHGQITAREYVVRLGNQVHPMIQMLFLNNDAVLQDDHAPIHTAGTVQPPPQWPCES